MWPNLDGNRKLPLEVWEFGPTQQPFAQDLIMTSFISLRTNRQVYEPEGLYSRDVLIY